MLLNLNINFNYFFMKKVFLFVMLLTVFNCFSQESDEVVELKNEIHINALLPIAFKTFEVSYERNLNESTSVGVSGLIANQDYYFTKVALTPYFRKYFSRGYAKGFFIEGFTMLNSGENYYYYYDENGYYSSSKDNYTDLAIGVGVGGKFIANDNFVGTVSLGIGRNLGENENFNHEEIVLKGGITLGYRF